MHQGLMGRLHVCVVRLGQDASLLQVCRHHLCIFLREYVHYSCIGGAVRGWKETENVLHFIIFNQTLKFCLDCFRHALVKYAYLEGKDMNKLYTTVLLNSQL